MIPLNLCFYSNFLSTFSYYRLVGFGLHCNVFKTFGGYEYSSMLMCLSLGLVRVSWGKPFLTVYGVHGFDYDLISA